MSQLSRRLWGAVRTGLISLEPMGAMAYYQAVAKIEQSQSESPRARRLELVSGARGVAGIALGDVQRAAPVGP